MALINELFFKKIRYALVCLVFCLLMQACKQRERQQDLNEEYVVGQTQVNNTSLSIPLRQLGNIPYDSISKLLTIHLEWENAPILGSYKVDRDWVEFTPLVPFTRGKTYEARVSGKKILFTEIAPDETGASVEINIYPSTDTIPENLLKIYLEFSRPMQDLYALDHIRFVRDNRDTLKNVFLDLQNELWNKERTILTLWLDPGRIKRELQPNEKLGNPLMANHRYKIIVIDNWRGYKGNASQATYSEDFFVGPRDTTIPDYKKWNILPPVSNSLNALKIELHESLDYLLVKNAIHIVDRNGKDVPGTVSTINGEKIFVFHPLENWKIGNYNVEIEARLEDLAGNNMNRLFDRDLQQPNSIKAKDVYRIPFNIAQ